MYMCTCMYICICTCISVVYQLILIDFTKVAFTNMDTDTDLT